MSVLVTVPTETVYEIKPRERGTKVWAVQRALNSLGYEVRESGVFTKETVLAVGDFQAQSDLTVDSVFGPKTSQTVAAALGSVIEQDEKPDIPTGLLRQLVSGESGGLIAAVNTSTPGGTDCGYLQRRVLESDYGKPEVVKRAFDGLYQMGLVRNMLASRFEAYFGQKGAKTREKAWRLATLYHNYPAAATTIAASGLRELGIYYRTPVPWVYSRGLTFPDGAPIRTPLEWCQHYSLGAPKHDEPGTMFQGVEV